ncbi:MAG: hypothetical protein EHM36_07000 [Deltaproteobacteria bacterium]|nr:MAG: hypothetical protein EHM36_07000 [Deltaproteobacteria bacterium]
MAKPTTEEIKKEIERLETMKPHVRRYSAFGDDHHAAIGAQIDVLRDGLDGDDVWDRFEHEKDNVRDAALEAVDWLEDQNEQEAPSEGWKELIVG